MKHTHQITLTSCPSCRSKRINHFLTSKDYLLTNEPFSVFRCKNCSLVFTNPIPPRTSLHLYYESEKYLSHQAGKRKLIDIVYRAIRAINIRKKYKLVASHKKPANVLEIGTGTGEMLEYFRRNGCRTTGIEPNENARNFAIIKHQLEVFTEEKLDELPDSEFDLVMMWHVLEHVYDLNERMSQVKKLLKPDGLLVVAVPNIDSYDFKYYQEFWAGLDVPRHLYHFSKSSMDYLLRNHDFRLLHTYPMKFDAFYVSLLSENYKGKSFPYVRALFKGLQSNFKAKKQNNNYSSQIFVARKI